MRKVIVSLMALILLSSVVYSIGLGVSPSTVKFENVLQGKTYTKMISVQTTTTEHDGMEVSLEIYNYTRYFDYPISLYIEPGQQKITVPIELKVPKRALGNFSTKALVRTCGKSLTYSELELTPRNKVYYTKYGICLGIEFDIKANITDKPDYNGFCKYILTKDIVRGEPLAVQTHYTNYGNVENRVIMDITIRDSSYNEVKNFRRFFTQPVGSTEWLNATFSRTHNAELGFYYADTKVYYRTDEGWKLACEKAPHFRVLG